MFFQYSPFSVNWFPSSKGDDDDEDGGGQQQAHEDDENGVRRKRPNLMAAGLGVDNDNPTSPAHHHQVEEDEEDMLRTSFSFNDDTDSYRSEGATTTTARSPQLGDDVNTSATSTMTNEPKKTPSPATGAATQTEVESEVKKIEACDQRQQLPSPSNGEPAARAPNVQSTTPLERPASRSPPARANASASSKQPASPTAQTSAATTREKNRKKILEKLAPKLLLSSTGTSAATTPSSSPAPSAIHRRHPSSELGFSAYPHTSINDTDNIMDNASESSLDSNRVAFSYYGGVSASTSISAPPTPPPQAPAGAHPTNAIAVFGIPLTIREGQLVKHFKDCGSICSVRIFYGKGRRSGNYAEIEFDSPATAADDAVREMDGYRITSRTKPLKIVKVGSQAWGATSGERSGQAVIDDPPPAASCGGGAEMDLIHHGRTYSQRSIASSMVSVSDGSMSGMVTPAGEYPSNAHIFAGNRSPTPGLGSPGSILASGGGVLIPPHHYTLTGTPRHDVLSPVSAMTTPGGDASPNHFYRGVSAASLQQQQQQQNSGDKPLSMRGTNIHARMFLQGGGGTSSYADLNASVNSTSGGGGVPTPRHYRDTSFNVDRQDDERTQDDECDEVRQNSSSNVADDVLPSTPLGHLQRLTGAQFDDNVTTGDFDDAHSTQESELHETTSLAKPIVVAGPAMVKKPVRDESDLSGSGAGVSSPTSSMVGTTTIRIGNAPHTMRMGQVYKLLARYGQVGDITMNHNRRNGPTASSSIASLDDVNSSDGDAVAVQHQHQLRSLTAFATFRNREDAEKAVKALHGYRGSGNSFRQGLQVEIISQQMAMVASSSDISSGHHSTMQRFYNTGPNGDDNDSPLGECSVERRPHRSDDSSSSSCDDGNAVVACRSGDTPTIQCCSELNTDHLPSKKPWLLHVTKLCGQMRSSFARRYFEEYGDIEFFEVDVAQGRRRFISAFLQFKDPSSAAKLYNEMASSSSPSASGHFSDGDASVEESPNNGGKVRFDVKYIAHNHQQQQRRNIDVTAAQNEDDGGDVVITSEITPKLREEEHGDISTSSTITSSSVVAKESDAHSEGSDENTNTAVGEVSCELDSEESPNDERGDTTGVKKKGHQEEDREGDEENMSTAAMIATHKKNKKKPTPAQTTVAAALSAPPPRRAWLPTCTPSGAAVQRANNAISSPVSSNPSPASTPKVASSPSFPTSGTSGGTKLNPNSPPFELRYNKMSPAAGDCPSFVPPPPPYGAPAAPTISGATAVRTTSSGLMLVQQPLSSASSTGPLLKGFGHLTPKPVKHESSHPILDRCLVRVIQVPGKRGKAFLSIRKTRITLCHYGEVVESKHNTKRTDVTVRFQHAYSAANAIHYLNSCVIGSLQCKVVYAREGDGWNQPDEATDGEKRSSRVRVPNSLLDAVANDIIASPLTAHPSSGDGFTAQIPVENEDDVAVRHGGGSDGDGLVGLGQQWKTDQRSLGYFQDSGEWGASPVTRGWGAPELVWMQQRSPPTESVAPASDLVVPPATAASKSDEEKSPSQSAVDPNAEIPPPVAHDPLTPKSDDHHHQKQQQLVVAHSPPPEEVEVHVDSAAAAAAAAADAMDMDEPTQLLLKPPQEQHEGDDDVAKHHHHDDTVVTPSVSLGSHVGLSPQPNVAGNSFICGVGGDDSNNPVCDATAVAPAATIISEADSEMHLPPQSSDHDEEAHDDDDDDQSGEEDEHHQAAPNTDSTKAPSDKTEQRQGPSKKIKLGRRERLKKRASERRVQLEISQKIIADDLDDDLADVFSQQLAHIAGRCSRTPSRSRTPSVASVSLNATPLNIGLRQNSSFTTNPSLVRSMSPGGAPLYGAPDVPPLPPSPLKQVSSATQLDSQSSMPDMSNVTKIGGSGPASKTSTPLRATAASFLPPLTPSAKRATPPSVVCETNNTDKKATTTTKKQKVQVPTYIKIAEFEKIRYIMKDSEVNAALWAIRGGKNGASNAPQLLGMDVEWEPNAPDATSHNPPALLQIATTSGEVFLFSLLDLSVQSVLSLGYFLNSPNFIKCGVGIDGDLQLLQSFYPGVFAHAEGYIDVAFVACKYLRMPRLGLLALAEKVGGIQGTWKTPGSQTAHWGRRPLSLALLQYAADDAMASLLILQGLIGHGIDVQEVVDMHTQVKQQMAHMQAVQQPWLYY